MTDLTPALLSKLPPPARDRLRALDDAADATHAVAAKASSRTDAAFKEFRAARRNAEDARSRGGSVVNQYRRGGRADLASALEAELDANDRAAADAKAEWKRLRALAAPLHDRAVLVAGLRTRVVQWLKDLKPAKAAQLVIYTGSAPKLGRDETTAAAVARVRLEIAAIRDEIATVEAAPVPVAEALARGREWARTLAEAAAPDVDGLFQPRQGPPEFPTRRAEILYDAGRRGVGFSDVVDSVALAAWLDPKRFWEALERDIIASSDDPDLQIPLADRAGRIAALGEKLERCERVEEAFIRMAEDAGQALDRRRDVRIDVMLGLERAAAVAEASE